MSDIKKQPKESAKYYLHKELGGIEMLDANYHRQCFSRHSHEGYTFGVIEHGCQRFFRAGKHNLAPKGSIILINADDIHNGQAETEEGWSYKALYPLPEHFEHISREVGCGKSFTPYFPNAVVHDEKLAEQFRAVYKILNSSDNRLLRESLLYSLLFNLLVKYGKKRQDYIFEDKSTMKMKIVKSFLDDLPEENISLSDLSNLVSLNPFYVVRLFTKEFGIPPHAYQVQARVRHSTRLIRNGEKLSDIAIRCGFHDQSHYIRHFKKIMGVTPRQYSKLYS